MKFLKALERAGTTRYILFKGKRLRYVIRGQSAVLRHVEHEVRFGLNVWWPNAAQHELKCWKVGGIIKA